MRMKRAAQIAIVYASILLVVFPILGEILLRSMGRRPWTPTQVAIKVEPGGRFFTADPTLGYRHLPGTFTVTLPDGFTFKATHLENTLRATHTAGDGAQASPKPEIWVFGCSFTHGWSLNDDQTYPWLLQEALPGMEVVNFGVSGYGTLQSLLQFQQAASARPAPRIAILAYGSFHDARNTFLRNRRKEVAPWNHLGTLVQPYARVDRQGRLTYSMAEVEYTEFPLMRTFAFAHAIEQIYDKYEDYLYDSHRVSKALMRRFADVAREHGVRLLVAGISDDASTREMLDFCRTLGISATDVAVDLLSAEFNNMPHDPHPNAAADRHYAQGIEAFLKREAWVE
jgi:hypothetical protein